MKPRLYSEILVGSSTPMTNHYRGLPPDLTEGSDTREEMGDAFFLTIEQRTDGVFLYRFDARGECVGDTWHKTIAEAKDQALYEFGDLVQGWQDVPEEVEDLVSFCLNRRTRSLDFMVKAGGPGLRRVGQA